MAMMIDGERMGQRGGEEENVGVCVYYQSATTASTLIHGVVGWVHVDGDCNSLPVGEIRSNLHRMRKP